MKNLQHIIKLTMSFIVKCWHLHTSGDEFKMFVSDMELLKITYRVNSIYTLFMIFCLEKINKETLNALIHPPTLEITRQNNPTLVLQVNERVPTSRITVAHVTPAVTCYASGVTVHLR